MRARQVLARTLAGAAMLAAASSAPTTVVAQPAPPGPVVVPTAVEAWYNIAPLAAPGLPPVNLYPPDTLHVGVTGGAEDSRTYLTLNLAGLPPSATITGGVLVLPVDPDGGTRDLEGVGMEACFAPEPGSEVQGSLDAPPPVDCSMRSAATYEPGTDRPVFRIDLAPFREVLDGGGLALLADDTTRAEGASWHVTLYGRENEAPDATAITATLELELPADDGADREPTPTGPGDDGPREPTAAPPPGDGSGEVASRLPDFGLPGELAAPSATDIDPGSAPAGAPSAPAVGEGPAKQPVAQAGPPDDGQFRYGVVFVLPLALLVFVWFFGSALTADPASEFDPRISI